MLLMVENAIARGSDPNLPGPHGDEKRGVVGLFLRRILGPTWYWLDLVDRKGRPDHGKIFGAIAFFWGLVVLWDIHAHLQHQPELMPFFLGFAALVFLAPYGIRGLAMWLKSRGGGTVDVVGEAAKAAIAARRSHGDGTFEPT